MAIFHSYVSVYQRVVVGLIFLGWVTIPPHRAWQSDQPQIDWSCFVCPIYINLLQCRYPEEKKHSVGFQNEIK